MKAFILTAAIMIGVIISGYTQTRESKQNRSPEMRATKMTEALEKKLNLTAAQKERIYDLNLERAKKMEKMHREHAAEKKEMMADRKEMMADDDKKMEKILNADQLKTYRELRSNTKEKAKKHHQRKKDGKIKKDKV